MALQPTPPALRLRCRQTVSLLRYAARLLFFAADVAERDSLLEVAACACTPGSGDVAGVRVEKCSAGKRGHDTSNRQCGSAARMQSGSARGAVAARYHHVRGGWCASVCAPKRGCPYDLHAVTVGNTAPV